MPWWTCFNCTNVRPQNSCNDVFVLDFAHHSLHDVPADVFQYERTLEELYLTSNRITELPRQLFYCHELKILYLNDNDLTQIPAAISSLVNLRKINLARNSLSRLTDSLTACRSLTYLDLSVNNLEKLPDAITSLLSLEELYLNDTFLEYLPTNFGHLTNLRILELRDNNLMTLPKSMSQLQHLRRLDIGNNEFSELPEVIGNLTELTELWCDENRIEQFNCNVANLKELIHFDGTNNLLKYLPTEIGNWQKCQELIMSTNELEELPFSIGMMKSLRKLKVDENQLQVLPDSICEMDNLEEIMISHNDLFKLPTTIGLLRRLRFLTADENLLRVLPNEICSCSSLTILSVRGNKLTKIPIDIGRLIQLRVLNIVNNFLSNLPVTILNLTQLSALWISDNQSQPLMPLQKEFHKETQSYYLTCYLLPQQPYATTDSSPPTNATSTPTTIQKSQSPSIYSDVQSQPVPPQHYPAYNTNYDDTPRNMHMTALDNMSLTAISANRTNSNTNMAVASKRRICFAADAPQDQPTPLDQSRLMRSPTPYPRELRMMANRFTNRNHQQQHQLQQYTQQKNLTNNLDEVDNLNQQFNAKLMKNQSNQSGTEVLTENNLNLHQHQPQYMNNFDQNKMNGLDDAVSLGNVRPKFNGNIEMNHLTNGIINGGGPNQRPVYNNEPKAAILHAAQGIVQLQQQQQQLQYQAAINQRQSAQNGYDSSPSHMPIPPAHPLSAHIPAQNYHHDQIPIDKDQLVLYESFSEVKNRQRLNAAAKTMDNGHDHHIATATPTPPPPPPPIQTNSISSNQKPINEIQRNFNQMYSTPPINHDNNSLDYENGYDNKPDNGLPPPPSLSINDYYNQNAAGDIIIQQNQKPKQSDQQQQPPPYHIAKAFTKKSKQDLLIYDIHRQQTNHHQSPQDLSTQSNVHTPTMATMVSDTNSSTQSHVDLENNETLNANIDEANNHYRSNSVRSINNSKSTINNSTSNWVFGEHKNPTVIQLSVPKATSDIGFKIIEHSNQGIFISEITSESTAAANKLRVRDKILDVDGVDFSKISLLDAQTVLSNAGPIMNIMISRGK